MVSWMRARMRWSTAAVILSVARLAPSRRKKTGALSLFDTVGRRTVTWYVVYYRRPDARRWWGRYLAPGFHHVELWRPTQFGPTSEDVFWTIVKPAFEFLEAETTLDPTPPWVKHPWVTCTQHVTATRRINSIRDSFFLGPQTCTEYVKAALGIRNFWVRTPYQLYNFIAARDCVITN